MKTLQLRAWIAAISASIFFGVLLRMHNALLWNFAWGYDGGAHGMYAFIIAHLHRLPTMSETYVAWHEPLYYVLTAPFFLHATFDGTRFASIFSGIIGVLTYLFLIVWQWKETRNRTAVLLTSFLLLALPVAISASTFFSNEGLVHFLILLALFVVARSKQPDSPKQILIVSLLLGLALLSKITAFVCIATVFAWYAWRAFAYKSKKSIVSAVLISLVSITIASPWIAYRTQAFHGVFTNPFEATLTKERLPSNYFTSFDQHMLAWPFWTNGRSSFWAMTSALTFTDYDALLLNPDIAKNVPGSTQVVLDRYVTPTHATLARYSLLLALALLPLFAWSCVQLCIRVWHERYSPKTATLFFLFLAASFSALLLNTLQHASLERGNVKTLFIFSAVCIFSLVFGSEIGNAHMDARAKKALQITALFLTAFYAATSFALTWI